MTHFRRYIPVIAVALGVIILQVVLSATRSTYYMTQITMSAYYALVVIGLCLLMGYAGQISLGHAGFFAIGGYTVAVLTTYNLMAYRDTPLVSLCRSLGLGCAEAGYLWRRYIGFFSLACFCRCDSADRHNRFYDWPARHSPQGTLYGDGHARFRADYLPHSPRRAHLRPGGRHLECTSL